MDFPKKCLTINANPVKMGFILGLKPLSCMDWLICSYKNGIKTPLEEKMAKKSELLNTCLGTLLEGEVILSSIDVDYRINSCLAKRDGIAVITNQKLILCSKSFFRNFDLCFFPLSSIDLCNLKRNFFSIEMRLIAQKGHIVLSIHKNKKKDFTSFFSLLNELSSKDQIKYSFQNLGFLKCNTLPYDDNIKIKKLKIESDCLNDSVDNKSKDKSKLYRRILFIYLFFIFIVLPMYLTSDLPPFYGKYDSRYENKQEMQINSEKKLNKNLSVKPVSDEQVSRIDDINQENESHISSNILETESKIKLIEEQKQATIKEIEKKLNAFIEIIKDIDDIGIIESVQVEKSGTRWYATIKVSNLWHLRHYQIRYQDTQTLWKVWAGLVTPNDPDSAIIAIIDQSDNMVGGSSMLAGSLIWVQEYD